MGSELGADDYLTQPFSPREFARAHKNGAPTDPRTLQRARQASTRFAPFASQTSNSTSARAVSNAARAEYCFDERRIQFARGSARAPERILTRDQLLEASRVYDNEVYDRAIDIQVLRLRRKIEADPSQPRFTSPNAVWDTSSCRRSEVIY